MTILQRVLRIPTDMLRSRLFHAIILGGASLASSMLERARRAPPLPGRPRQARTSLRPPRPKPPPPRTSSMGTRHRPSGTRQRRSLTPRATPPTSAMRLATRRTPPTTPVAGTAAGTRRGEPPHGGGSGTRRTIVRLSTALARVCTRTLQARPNRRTKASLRAPLEHCIERPNYPVAKFVIQGPRPVAKDLRVEHRLQPQRGLHVSYLAKAPVGPRASRGVPTERYSSRFSPACRNAPRTPRWIA